MCDCGDAESLNYSKAGVKKNHEHVLVHVGGGQLAADDALLFGVLWALYSERLEDVGTLAMTKRRTRLRDVG